MMKNLRGEFPSRNPIGKKTAPPKHQTCPLKVRSRKFLKPSYPNSFQAHVTLAELLQMPSLFKVWGKFHKRALSSIRELCWTTKNTKYQPFLSHPLWHLRKLREGSGLSCSRRNPSCFSCFVSLALILGEKGKSVAGL